MTKIIINKSISQHWSEFISSPFHETKKKRQQQNETQLVSI